MNWLRRLWAGATADPVPKLTGRVFDYTTSKWGHKIHRWDKRSENWFIMGHGPCTPQWSPGTSLRPGDVLTSQMESGRVGRFIVLEARYFPDPPDMFRAVVAWLGYQGNLA